MLLILLLALGHVASAWIITQYYWRPQRLADAPTMIGVTALTTFLGVPIVLGWVSSIMNVWTILAALVLAVSLAIVAWKFGTRSFANRDVLKALRAVGWWQLLGWSAIALWLALLLVLGSRLPIRAWDASYYHVINPMRWAMSHRFDLNGFGETRPTGQLHIETFPNVKATLIFLVMEFCGGIRGTAMAQWPYLALLPALVLSIARRLNLPHWAAQLAVWFTLLAPEVMFQSIEAYADIAFMAGQVALVWAILLVYQQGPARRNLEIAGLCTGLLAGSKPTAVLMGAGLNAVLLVVIVIGLRRQGLRKVLLGFSYALGLIMAAYGAFWGPWAVHGIRKFGNPIFPVEIHAFGRILAPGTVKSDVNRALIKGFTGKEGWDSWWNMMMELPRVTSLANWSGGLGAHALIFGLPAFVIMVLLVIAKRNRSGMLVCFLFIVMQCASVAPNYARMVLFELVAMGLAFSTIVTGSGILLRIPLLAGLVCIGCFNVYCTLPSILYRQFPAEIAAYALLSGETRACQTNRFPEDYDAMNLWCDHFAGPRRKLAFTGSSHWSAAPADKYYGVEICRVDPPANPGLMKEWIATLLQDGVTHLVLPATSPFYQPALMTSGMLRVIFRHPRGGNEHPWMQSADTETCLFELLKPKGAG